MEQLRVLIVDEHQVVIDALFNYLSNYPDIKIVGTASDGMGGLAELIRLQPDCMIVDLSQPKICGLEAIRLYLKEKPDLEIVAYTEDTDEISIHDALDEGVRVYVSKCEPVAYLASVLRNVQHSGSSINQKHLH